VRKFARFACIDWSGQAVARPKGLAVAECERGNAAPELIVRSDGWSRQDILDWLVAQGRHRADLLIGLDLSPALPFADRSTYFPEGAIQPDRARALWALIDETCTHEPHLGASTFADHPNFAPHFRRHGGREGVAFGGGAGRYRVVEHRQRACGVSPVSCFNLVGAAQVGKSSLTGMRVLHRLGSAVPVWPFDPIPATGPLIIEIYTSIAARAAGIRKGRSKMRDGESLDAALAALGSRSHEPLVRYDDHSTDAILTAAWLRAVSDEPDLWAPRGLEEVRHTEGWTFGAR
jgi:hypothetical protein